MSSEANTKAEAAALKATFNLLARNLLTYGREPNTFSAVGERERAILAVRDRSVESLDLLADQVAHTVSTLGAQPRVGTYCEDYTVWSFSSESAMLPRLLSELTDHRAQLIALYGALGDNADTEAGQLISLAIEAHAETLADLNELCDGICDPAVLAASGLPEREAVTDEPHGH